MPAPVVQTPLLTGLRLVSLRTSSLCMYPTAVSRLRRPFLSHGFFFLTMKLRPGCQQLGEQDWTWSRLTEYSGVPAEEQKRRCGLPIDRV